MRRLLRARLILAPWLLILLAGCSPSSEEQHEDDRPEPVEASIDLTLGVAEGEEAYMFGSVSGITSDDDGHIYIVDSQAHEIRAFDEEGVFLFAVGEYGEGPGELNHPCCLTFDSGGHLWARDVGNARYNRYEHEGDRFSPAGTISMNHASVNMRAPTTFDAEGNLIDIGGRTEGDRIQQYRYHLDPVGNETRAVKLPYVPAEELRQHVYDEFEVTVRETVIPVSVVIAQPFGPSSLTAHSPTGDWAHAVSSRYEVHWYDERGTLVRTVARNEEGPRLSDGERDQANEELAESIESTGASPGEVPLGVPERKPPLSNLFFDTEGRLWVERTAADGDDPEADVYDREGDFLKVVRWPAGITFNYGLITEDAAYGLEREGAGGADRVVRLAF